MAEHVNPRIQSLLNAVDTLHTLRHPQSHLRQQEKIQNLIDSFLPEDHDDLLNAFDGGEVIKDLWEEIIRPYIIPARIAMGQALIRIGSPKIRSLLVGDLLRKDEERDPKNLDKQFNRMIAAIYILGQGPYENDQEVLESLRGVFGKGNYSVLVETIGVFIPVLGTPVTSYYTYELAGFSLVNLGDLSMLEEILFAQLVFSNIKDQSKDGFIKWVYSLDRSATIQALNNIASYDTKKKKNRWFPNYTKMISALTAIGEEDCIGPLSILYEQKDASIRILALKALGKIGGESALMIIRKATEDRKFNIRQNAKKILKQLTKE